VDEQVLSELSRHKSLEDLLTSKNATTAPSSTTGNTEPEQGD